MAKYTVFESTNMSSTFYGERIFDCVNLDADVENGTFGYLGDQVEEGSHIYKFVAGAKEGEKVIVADHPAWKHDTSLIANQRRDQFVNEAGTPFRARVVKPTDEFGITAQGFKVPADAAVGILVGIEAATGKLEKVTDVALAFGKVMRKRTIGGTIVTAAHTYGSQNEIYEIKVLG